MVSKYVCNEHAELFGLTYEMVDYTNGNNDNWSKIVTYICSTANFHLPLFRNRNGEILVDEIHAFALTVCNNYPNVNREEFESRIACAMGMNAYDPACSYGGWMDDESNSMVIVQNGENVSAISQMPKLHRMLLHYTSPSITRNLTNGSQLYLVPTLSLEYDTTNPATDTYHFVIPSKQSVLKKTHRPNSVATPIVVNAVRNQQATSQLRVFKPITTASAMC